VSLIFCFRKHMHFYTFFQDLVISLRAIDSDQAR
jgi:hypothetical protein